MKITKKRLVVVQVTVFVVATACIGTFAYYLPNPPPLLRQWIVKKRINIMTSDVGGPDERFLEWFNRDPERKIPSKANIVVSPADGFIDAIKEVGDTKHIVIEMRYSDVHVQRVPIAGKVIQIEGEGKQLPGNMSVGDYTLEKKMPFQKVSTIMTEIGPVKVRQITSFFAKRISVFIKEGDTVERGQRLGKILAGSTIVIELPAIVEILVSEEQNVFGGETIIAKYKSEQKGGSL